MSRAQRARLIFVFRIELTWIQEYFSTEKFPGHTSRRHAPVLRKLTQAFSLAFARMTENAEFQLGSPGVPEDDNSGNDRRLFNSLSQHILILEIKNFILSFNLCTF